MPRTAGDVTLDTEELARGIPSRTHLGRPDTAGPNPPDCLQSGPTFAVAGSVHPARPSMAYQDGRYESVIALTVLTLPLSVLTSVSIRTFKLATDPACILLPPGRLHNGPQVLGPGGHSTWDQREPEDRAEADGPVFKRGRIITRAPNLR